MTSSILLGLVSCLFIVFGNRGMTVPRSSKRLYSSPLNWHCKRDMCMQSVCRIEGKMQLISSTVYVIILRRMKHILWIFLGIVIFFPQAIWLLWKTRQCVSLRVRGSGRTIALRLEHLENVAEYFAFPGTQPVKWTIGSTSILGKMDLTWPPSPAPLERAGKKTYLGMGRYWGSSKRNNMR